MWMYRAQVFSRKRTYRTAYDVYLTDEEHADPECRAYAEGKATFHLRHMEGVTPETPIESNGWRHIEFGGIEQ